MGKQYSFAGDSVLLQDGFLRNFHLKPARILYRTYHNPLPAQNSDLNCFTISGKKITLVTKPIQFVSTAKKLSADVVIISKNPKIYLENLIKVIDCKLIVFDSSNPEWKVKYWKKDCERLQLTSFYTKQKGAFVLNL
jgi:competence protein ComEC